MTRKLTVVALVTFFIASVALADWLDDYDTGVNLARKGQWQAVVQKMNSAIAKKPKENDRERTYGTQFINYHPYYYRGFAYLQLGQYEKAIDDFGNSTGAGELDLGAIDTLVSRAKGKLAAASTPEPQPQPTPQPVVPQPQPVRPVPAPQPAAPTISPAVRQQFSAAVSEANAALASARNRKAASTPPYNQAMQQLADANSKGASAKSDDDLNAAIASANNAKMFADSATGATGVAIVPTPVPVQPSSPTKAAGATAIALNPTAQRVRSALEAYFRGDFDVSTPAFKSLAKELPTNGWIFAFLGASQYSLYAFEADEAYKTEAIQSFKKAKQLHFKKGLPEKYFSRRIRRVFNGIG